MKRVVDASSVIAYLLGEGSQPEREAMLGDAHAPTLVDVEATQTLRGLVRGSRIDLARAETARAELGQLRMRRHPDASLLRRAWELRDVCTTYDALYVALAEALDATLLTRDGRLAAAVGRLVDVDRAEQGPAPAP
ncbi:MAG TPA: type II toxin-antitoxin system VapC family toxin [Gaiellaceae bacterium]|nr:type II toxin-antitoxin system VapC family toxin [Gaiellaceae bacterium]